MNLCDLLLPCEVLSLCIWCQASHTQNGASYGRAWVSQSKAAAGARVLLFLFFVRAEVIKFVDLSVLIVSSIVTSGKILGRGVISVTAKGSQAKNQELSIFIKS